MSKIIEIQCTDITQLPDGLAMGKKDVTFIMIRDNIIIDPKESKMILDNEALDLIEGVEYDFRIIDNKFVWEFNGRIFSHYIDLISKVFSRIVFEAIGPVKKKHLKKNK